LLASVALRRLMMPREAIDAAWRLVPASVRARFGRRARTTASGETGTLDALTASARDRRTRAPAPEIVAAREATGEAERPASSPWTGAPEPKKEAPAPEVKPDAPRSLAENLVARRKKKK